MPLVSPGKARLLALWPFFIKGKERFSLTSLFRLRFFDFLIGCWIFSLENHERLA